MVTQATTTAPATAPPLVDPAKSHGLVDVWRRRYLTRLLVSKEVRVRYQGSFLGLLWTYVKPLVRYFVYFFIFGYVLGVGDRIENFAVYVFAGLIVVMFFNEALSSSTRSVRGNSGLINKIFLPREMFPLVSVMVSTRHFLPQLGVLLVITTFNGWRPSWTALGAAVAGFALIFFFLVGLGLIFSTLNVYFRDAEQVVEIVTMVAFWSAPVMYSWTFIRDVIGDGWLLTLYLSNPLCVSVNLFHEAFWAPTTANPIEPPDLAVPGSIAVGIVLTTLIVGQVLFSRLQGRFASEL
jgi:ABC-2 type transport system permease protein